jgi:hypothetical protein
VGTGLDGRRRSGFGESLPVACRRHAGGELVQGTLDLRRGGGRGRPLERRGTYPAAALGAEAARGSRHVPENERRDRGNNGDDLGKAVTRLERVAGDPQEVPARAALTPQIRDAEKASARQWPRGSTVLADEGNGLCRNQTECYLC